MAYTTPTFQRPKVFQRFESQNFDLDANNILEEL